jgi:hypothetical protein
MNIKLSDLTAVGWLLTLATIGIIVVLMIYSGSIWNDVLPAGRYPAILLAAPGLIIGIVFFAVGAFVLKAAGLPAFKRPPTPDQQPREPLAK